MVYKKDMLHFLLIKNNLNIFHLNILYNFHCLNNILHNIHCNILFHLYNNILCRNLNIINNLNNTTDLVHNHFCNYYKFVSFQMNNNLNNYHYKLVYKILDHQFYIHFYISSKFVEYYNSDNPSN